MLTSLDEHLVLVFAVQLVVLLALARTLGFVARRVGQPPIVGELAAGLLLGPSILGRVAPGVSGWLFPDSDLQWGLLYAVAWLGAALLLATTGTEIDLGLLRRLVRGTPFLPLLSVLVPLVAGVTLGWLLPEVFLPSGASRPVFAAFVGVALTISGLPVVARILFDMGLLRRDMGQMTLAAASFDDVVGWLLLGVVSRLTVDPGGWGPILVSVAAAAVFLVGAFTVGQRLADAALRASFRLTDSVSGPFTVALIVVLSGAALSEWVGLDALFGALMAGVVLGRSPLRRSMVRGSISLLSTAVLAPVFFATVGMALDVSTLGDASTAAWAILVLVVAVVTKVGGAWLGALLGPLRPAGSLAVGVALSARGGLAVVVATIAATQGVFTDVAFTTVVLVAVATSVLSPTLLRRLLPRLPTDPVEAERLQREALLRASRIVSAARVLLPTRGGANSRVAARIVDLALDEAASVTVLSVAEKSGAVEVDAAPRHVAELFGHRRVEQRRRPQADPARVILDEAARGYDLLVVGASADIQLPRQLSATLQRLLTDSPVPVVLVRSREDVEGLVFRRIITAASGTAAGDAAEDVAYVLAANSGAEVDVVHVIARSDRVLTGAWLGNADRQPAAQGLIGRSLVRARQFGMTPSGLTRVGASAWEELLRTATERDADVIVVATQTRDLGDRPFLGHGIEYLLEHAPQTLVIVAFPPDRRPEWDELPGRL